MVNVAVDGGQGLRSKTSQDTRVLIYIRAFPFYAPSHILDAASSYLCYASILGASRLPPYASTPLHSPGPVAGSKLPGSVRLPITIRFQGLEL